MTISIRCNNPDCGKPCQVKDEYAGRSVKCPGCGSRITVPSQPTSSSDEPAEEKVQRIEPSAQRRATPQPAKQLPPEPHKRPTAVRWAVWPWLIGIAATLLVGASGGYFLAPSQTKKSEEQLAPGDPKSQEMATLRAALEAAKAEAAAAKAELAKANPNSAPPKAAPDQGNTGPAKAKEDESKAKPPTDPPTEPKKSILFWSSARAAKLIITIKKTDVGRVEAGKLPKHTKEEYKKRGDDFYSALVEDLGQLEHKPTLSENSLFPLGGEGGVVMTLFLKPGIASYWPKDNEGLIEANLWGGATFTKGVSGRLLYNLLLTGEADKNGVIKGKVTGSTEENDNFQFSGAAFEWHPIP